MVDPNSYSLRVWDYTKLYFLYLELLELLPRQIIKHYWVMLTLEILDKLGLAIGT